VGNALWLSWAVPFWYFITIASPFSAGPLSAIPALGVLSLAIGVIWGVVKREGSLLVFLIPFAASEIFAIVAGFWRGAFIRDPAHLLAWISGAFLLLQIAGSAYVVWKLKGARWPAAAVAIFNSSYALFAIFVAGMSFSDSWL